MPLGASAAITKEHRRDCPARASVVNHRLQSVILSIPQGATMSDDLQGRNAVVFGVANKRSIAWSIAQGLHAAGMKLAITYQNERLEQEARDLILSLPGAEAYMCDVSKDDDID